jgi:tRNA-2-methylthio-N6-dimethylallyladenosine synthase
MASAGKSNSYDGKGKRIAIVTFGCQMNVRDSEIICGLLRANNYELTANPEEADVVIFNTCSVRQHAEDKVWSEVGRFAKRKKGDERGRNLILGIVGCMAQNYKEQVFDRAPQVDFVVGPSDIDKIPGIISKLIRHPSSVISHNFYETKVWETEGETRPEGIYHTGFFEDKEHAYVVISEGCSNFCSYCVVPYVRGALRNRHYKEVLKEIKESVDRGITKITLLGQNVNAYQSPVTSHQSPVDFIELLGLVNEINGLKEFSFITSHPKDTSIDLFRVMGDSKRLKKYLHLPVQSGSDKVLKLMNRGYTNKFYFDLVDNYSKIVKNGVLTTDIIVGFPGETEKDFQDTYDLVKTVEFNAAYIFKYSPRPHTQAARLPDDCLKEEKEKRHKLILDLQKKISKKKEC